MENNDKIKTTAEAEASGSETATLTKMGSFKAKHPKLFAELKDILSTVLIAAAVAFLLNMFVFSLTEVRQTSMYPTLKDSEVVFLSKISYWFNEPASGDIIVFSRKTAEKNYVKRIIGVPGDKIEIKSGMVYRNGVLLDEPYLNGMTTWGTVSVEVPENKYFVLGDNRKDSIDSRSSSIGYVDRSEIMGKVVFKIIPPGSITQYSHAYANAKQAE